MVTVKPDYSEIKVFLLALLKCIDECEQEGDDQDK